ncbi:MAG TPA: hypothetical protein VJO99_27355, partial [Burkholderiaceae bacterium]|nr:hypothetical protein [Burkholderiaceae bacterium]
MNRRRLLQAAASAPVLAALSPSSNAAALLPATFQRVRPTDPDWPAPALWARLGEAVGGRLS